MVAELSAAYALSSPLLPGFTLPLRNLIPSPGNAAPLRI